MRTSSPRPAGRPDRPTAGGFTLVELLVVVAVLGILAALSANLIGAREKAYLSVMKADLRNLASVQAPYAADNYEFASETESLPFTASEGITLELVGEDGGFTARTTHAGLPGARCALFLGTVSAPLAPAAVEGAIVCDGAGVAGGGGAGPGGDNAGGNGGGPGGNNGKGRGDSCGQGVPNSDGKAQGVPC